MKETEQLTWKRTRETQKERDDQERHRAGDRKEQSSWETREGVKPNQAPSGACTPLCREHRGQETDGLLMHERTGQKVWGRQALRCDPNVHSALRDRAWDRAGAKDPEATPPPPKLSP